MRNRAPWALTLYFSFFLILLVWGRLPEEPNLCSSSGIRLLSPASQQILTEYLPTPFCPACGDPRSATGPGAAPITLMGNSLHPDGKNSSPAVHQALPFFQTLSSLASDRIVPFPPLTDTRLASLRTVVLLI